MTTDDVNDASRAWYSLTVQDTAEKPVGAPVYEGKGFWAFGHTIGHEPPVISRDIHRDMRVRRVLSRKFVRGRYTVEVMPALGGERVPSKWYWTIEDAQGYLVTDGDMRGSRSRAKRDALRELARLGLDDWLLAFDRRVLRRAIHKGNDAVRDAAREVAELVRDYRSAARERPPTRRGGRT